MTGNSLRVLVIKWLSEHLMENELFAKINAFLRDDIIM